ncbi:hypothetical protein MRB53_013976 [Persea americana]|uniref:Uncharacterized protein n=1 Tax=Persea americana TaxID=3435 RepID=A0ACC2K9J1_PERAE|nr:hypothetical protein MRB53_013976 [Persea americana]
MSTRCSDPDCVGSDPNSGRIDLITEVGQPLTLGTDGFITGARMESAHNIIHECRISTLWSARAVNDGGPSYDDIYLQDGSVFIQDEEVNEILTRYEVRSFDYRLDLELYNEGDDDGNDDDGGDESGGGEEEGGDDDNEGDESRGGEQEGGDGDGEGDHEDDDDSDDENSDDDNGNGGSDENGFADYGYVSDGYEANGF